jgi:hypothetical protein
VAADVETSAAVTQTQRGQFRVALKTVRDGTPGERNVEATSCRSLADATALILALTIDPALIAAPETPPLEARPAEPPAPIAPSPPLAPPPAPPTPSKDHASSSVHAAVLVEMGADLGTLPKAAYGFALASALLLGPARVEGYGSYWPAQPARATGSSSAGGLLRLALGGARVCYAGPRGVFELAGCAGFELGVLHGEGFGVVYSRATDSLWIAGSLGVRASFELTPRLRLAVDVGIAVPFRRDEFVLDQLGTLHQTSAVVGRALGGPEIRF